MKDKAWRAAEFVVVAILVIASTFGLNATVLNNEFLLPKEASAQAIPIDKLFSIHWVLIAFFFSLIIVFMLYSIFRSWFVHGRKPSSEGYGEYFEGNAQLEVIWTIVPLAIVLYLAYVGAGALAEVERRDPRANVVNVVASQWNWRFEYEYEGIKVVSSELVVPVNVQTLLKMRSTDVIHSFWVPEFRVKQDVLPGDEGFEREIRITPTLTGAFKLRCAELCGTQHYNMLANVVVMPQSEYDAWIALQAADCTLSDAECGERWANQYGCLACHSVDGTTIVGPTWLHLYGETTTLADGSTVVADDTYLLNSIINPSEQIVNGFNDGIMPQNFADTLEQEQITQIIAFIQSLGE